MPILAFKWIKASDVFQIMLLIAYEPVNVGEFVKDFAWSVQL